MSGRGAVVLPAIVAGVVLLGALGLIGLGLVRMTGPSEAVPFRSACQGDDACRQALAERLPALQAQPGGAAAWTHEALTHSSPVFAPDATLAVCQATGTPESCAVDPTRLKPGEAGALIAVFDAYSLARTRQERACRYLDGCAVRTLAALGEYAFDPVRIQGALQRTTYPLPPALKRCVDAPLDDVPGACEAEGLLKAAPEPLTVALEQDWRSGGAQARLPRPADPQAELTKNALWAGLGAAVGMLLVGSLWAGVAVSRRDPDKARLTKAAQVGAMTAAAPAMSAPARHAVFEPPAEPPVAPARPNARPPDPARSIHPTRGSGKAAQEAAPPASQAVEIPAPRPSDRRTAEPIGARAAASPPPAEVIAFQAALAIPGPAETFARLVEDEGARLSPRFDGGERLAAGAILAAHRLRGDRPVEAHAGAYDALVFGLAGSGHRLIWPRAGSPITAEMETTDNGDLYSHTVEAAVRPGLVDASGAVVVRPRVLAR